MQTKRLTKEQALQKLRHFCGYQERCHRDVKDKLFSLHVKPADADEIIATLINEEYLDEERYAIAFAGGKFRIKQWGRIKIEQELKRRAISKYCISKAMAEIDQEQYFQTLLALVRKKQDSLTEEKSFIRKKKVTEQLLLKGYEADMIQAAIKKMEEESE